ncbi:MULTISPECIES: PadR family transcriptional regulator [unclassified Streptosporangium]|uniref:PadR family transcriptional regulator n=1 Tax=unclassified Streptosporangium TaxID=2632669 RepID=UPI002E2C20E7|nr:MULTISPECIES: PadR family transcriptional regulator [unclassified Streptosporangium]
MSQRTMTEPAFLVLTALVDAPRHGYGIVQEVEKLSEGRVQLKIGTLYGVLDRLAADELVVLDREEAQQGRLRRYYRLTESGAQALEAEAARLAENVRSARERLRVRSTHERLHVWSAREQLRVRHAGGLA